MHRFMPSRDAPESFLVPVLKSEGGKATAFKATAFIGPASWNDLPSDWSCDWRSIWSRTDFDCQAIIKMTESDNLWGMMRYSLYPYNSDEPGNTPNFLFIENIEAHPARQPPETYAYKREKPRAPVPFVNPVGKWLMWYACKTALDYCSIGAEPILGLGAESRAVDYYRDIIGMKMVDIGLSSTGGDTHAFNFNRDSAQIFCDLQRAAYGNPQAVIAP